MYWVNFSLKNEGGYSVQWTMEHTRVDGYHWNLTYIPTNTYIVKLQPFFLYIEKINCGNLPSKKVSHYFCNRVYIWHWRDAVYVNTHLSSISYIKTRVNSVRRCKYVQKSTRYFSTIWISSNLSPLNCHELI